MTHIERLRLWRSSSILSGSLIGAGIGASVGFGIDYFTRERSSGNSTVKAVALCGVLGGLVGTIIGIGEGDSGVLMNFACLTTSQRAQLIREALQSGGW